MTKGRAQALPFLVGGGFGLVYQILEILMELYQYTQGA